MLGHRRHPLPRRGRPLFPPLVWPMVKWSSWPTAKPNRRPPASAIQWSASPCCPKSRCNCCWAPSRPTCTVSTADGEPASRVEIPSDALECRQSWYTPWGGPPAVRSLAHSGDWVFADIHVGSIMRSPDRGATWEPVTPDLHADVHQVATAPMEGRLYANTADAVLCQRRLRPLLGASEGRIGKPLWPRLSRPPARSRLPAGQRQQRTGSWRRCAGQALLFRTTRAAPGLGRWLASPKPRAISTPSHIAFDAEGIAWVAVEDQLYRSEDRGESWSAFLASARCHCPP